MRATTVRRALKTLSGVQDIARREQLIQGNYFSQYFDPKLKESGAICGGHTACLIGSLWIAAGVTRPVQWYDFASNQDVDDFTIYGFDEGDRVDTMRNRPHLRLAYNALNETAKDYAQRKGLSLTDEAKERAFESDAEALFEYGLAHKNYDEIRDTVIEVCELAKRRIRRQYKEVLSETNKEKVAA